MDSFDKRCEELAQKIKDSYESSITVEDAESLSAEFLSAQLLLADQIRHADLDARMRKSGLKALKAAVYLEHATKSEKKPSDVMLQAIVDSEKMVQTSQDELDAAEVEVDRLKNYMDTFRNAHIYYRNIGRGAL